MSHICKIIDKNNTHHKSFTKETSGRHFYPHHELWSLKFPYLLLLAILIKLAFSTGLQMLFALHYI